MATWPSGTKASQDTTDAASDSISGARGDINQAINNQNDIIDMFNIASPSDNDILVYNASNTRFELQTQSGGNPLTADLDVDNFSIVNTTDGTSTNRGNAFKIGTESGTQYDKTNLVSLPAGFDVSGGGGDRICGPIDIYVVDDFNTWNERIHSMPSLFKTSLSDNYGEPGAPSSERGATRIRNRYTESILDTASYTWGDGVVRFGDGLISQYITSKIYNSVAATSSTATSTTALLAAPQSDGNVGTQTITHMRGMLVSPFLDANATATNLYGYQYDTSNINASATVTNHYSFSSTDTNAKFVNAGPVTLSGLNYPTSDGTADQLLKTDGAGNLSFVDSPDVTLLDITQSGTSTFIEPSTTNDNLILSGNGSGGSGGHVSIAPLLTGANNVVYLADTVKVQYGASVGNIVGWSTGSAINNTLNLGDINNDIKITTKNALELANQNISSTPTNTSTPAAWLELTINGSTYYQPLYQ